jgi:hypothetical protein
MLQRLKATRKNLTPTPAQCWRKIMNNGERLMSAVQWSSAGKGTRRKDGGLTNLLLVLALVVLATMAVVLAATPAEAPVTAEPDRPAPVVSLSGNELTSESTPEDPVSGAWSSKEAELLACSKVYFPALLCSTDSLEVTP